MGNIGISYLYSSSVRLRYTYLYNCDIKRLIAFTIVIMNERINEWYTYTKRERDIDMFAE